MFIGNIFELKGLLSQLNPLSRPNQSASTPATAATGVSSSSAPGGSLSSAALQALAQIGVPGLPSTAPSSSGSSSGSTSQQQSNQALQDFLQRLFAALQQQNVNTTGNETSVKGATGTSGIKAHHHHGGVGQELQNLMQQLSAGPSAGNGAAPASGAGSSSLAALQTSFNKLIAASGATGSGATLGNFLNAFGRDLPGRAAAGNILSTRA